LKLQHAGKDVWDKLNRESEVKLQQSKWTGTTNITLQQHMSMHQHRHEWITLQDCSQHIPVDVPNGCQRVTWLSMNSITLLANFESAVAYLAPVCPAAAKQQKKGKFEANVSGTAGALGAIGKTGVALHYHKHADFMKLREDQKKELKEWRASNSGESSSGKKRMQGGSNNSGNKKFKSMLAALSAETKEAIQAVADSNTATIAAVAAGIESSSPTPQCVSIGAATTVKPTSHAELITAQVAALKLQNILKRDDSKKEKRATSSLRSPCLQGGDDALHVLDIGQWFTPGSRCNFGSRWNLNSLIGR